MADYRQSTVAGTSWRRSFAVRMLNPLAVALPKTVTFDEEDVVDVGSGTPMTAAAGNCSVTFVPATTFPLINPATGAPLGTSMSHQDLLVALHSLYLATAKARDAAAAAALTSTPLFNPLA